MSNIGKFTDRSPNICPAGKVNPIKDNMAECLQFHPIDDAIETVMHEAGLKKVDPEYRRQNMSDWRHRAVYQESHAVLHPPGDTRYQTLLKDLRATVDQSYWKKEVGKGSDPIGLLPAHIDPLLTTFGDPTPKNATVKDLVNPPISNYEILFDTSENHRIYRLSHNDYYPGEQIKHNYLEPPFHPKKLYGKPSNYDPRGMCMKVTIKDANREPITIANQIQANFFEKTKFQLGKSRMPNFKGNSLPQNRGFGKATERPAYGLEEILKPDLKPDLCKKQVLKSIEHLNEIRGFVKRHGIDLIKALQTCKYFDKELSGWLKLDVLCKILSMHYLTFNHDLVLSFACKFGYVKDDLVRYSELLDLFNVNKEYPDIGKLDGNIDFSSYYITSNKAAEKDYLKIDNSKCPTAGIPSIHMETSTAIDIGHLGNETKVEHLIKPSIYTNYSLSHYDFWHPRSKEYLRSLFEKVGYEFPGDTFEKMWDIGVGVDKTGGVCVETFKQLLEMAAPLEKVEQPQRDCHKDIKRMCEE